jgi:hypothetical protein
MNYTKIALTAHLKKLGYNLEPFMIVGVRSKADKPDAYDDKIYLICRNGYFSFNATTNPGVHWLHNWLNPKGAAVLKPGKYFYKLGKHKGYEALVQAYAVTVYRDTNKDDKSDSSGFEETGFFGINIHRALESGIANFIGKFSAGCQVIQNPADFKRLIVECKSSNLKLFPYYLINEF